MKLITAVLLAWSILVGTSFGNTAETLHPAYLRTEYRVNPSGIDTTRPRLSWIVESSHRTKTQSAYRVLAASSIDALNDDRGDLWDSGKVESDDTTAIVYGGKPLSSRARCYWKVMTWDEEGRNSGWSEPASWTMGLLKKTDWQAKWIGYDRPVEQMDHEHDDDFFAGASWIWYSAAGEDKRSPPGARFFGHVVTIPEDRQIQSAKCAFAADDNFQLFINGRSAAQGIGFAQARQKDVSPFLRPGKNVIAISATNAGESANPAGLIGALRISFQEGEPLTVVTDQTWLASDQGGDDWMKLSADNQNWQPAARVGGNGDGPWGKVPVSRLQLPPARYLRTAFPISKGVRRATVYASALGLYELHVNGHRVSDDYFTPGWTDYDKRVYYQTYDVTKLMRQGENAVGAVLADGWYAGYLGYRGRRDSYGNHTRLCVQLEVEFEDGSTAVVATGPQWKAYTGPMLEADMLMGETYDARREMPGWDRHGFDASAWYPVDVTDHIDASVDGHPGEPVRQITTIHPVGMREVAPGTIVVNMGQNFAGVVRLRVQGEKGRRIHLCHAERLNPDGTIYTANLRRARAADTYICRGDEAGAWWQPRFTFHGFQYVEVTGYPGTLSPEDIEGVPLSSDTPVVGKFACSDPMLNRLFSNIYWTQRMNFIDIPTDCPQRDERLGWTGDAQVYIRAASMIADVHAFFTKWLIDLNDAQRADGQYPMFAPLNSKGPTNDGGPAWADAGVICPWNVYEVYGDKRVLTHHYQNMQRFIEFCVNRSTPALLPPDTFHAFGDWLNVDDNTPKDVIYTAYMAHSTQLLSRIAAALGKTADAAKYDGLFHRMKLSFNKAFVAADGRIKGDSQTSYVLALAFDLTEGQRREQAEQHLIRRIADRDWRLSTGFIGTKDLMLVLSKIGRNDVAYRLLHNTAYPSWGFSIAQGATTIWERWNGWTPEDGFADPHMNSFAHYSFGAVAQWMFETIGGIQSKGPAFKRIRIQPRPDDKILWAKVSYRSIRGLIATDWRIEDGQFKLDVEIPANTTAEIRIPGGNRASIVEGGRPAESSPGVAFLRMDDGAAVYEVGSGHYSFVAPQPQIVETSHIGEGG